ncbi:MAG: MFS transporter [Cyclobacteriaceae bacterium]|nr:MFS transporter [Cyclobacteriaceae bacterium]
MISATSSLPQWRRIGIMAALIGAGECVFLLPFVVARIFRPTFLDVFDLTNLQLGTAFALYGVVAMVSYFLGGPLADKFSARKLMTLALIATSVGGVLFATVPGLKILTLLYGFWGFTTIMLFWAALIRATREWGGVASQGRAYGILDGGRGFLAALLASISVMIFAALLPEDVSSATLAQRTTALKQIIGIFTGIVLAIALVVWLSVPDSTPGSHRSPEHRLSKVGVRKVLQMPNVWLQAIIVVCAYVGYKCTDDFSLYARDAFGYDDVAAARIGTISFWVRPFAAVGAGLLADHFKASWVVALSFVIMLLGSMAIAMGALQLNVTWMLVFTVAATSAGIYGLRGIYFALFEEGKVPLALTGTAVGLVSTVGFTPDIFMGPLMGYLIDRSPGALGHQHVFMVLTAFALVGLISALWFRQVSKKPVNSETKGR